MLKMSEYSFVAGMLATGLALVCYAIAFASVRLSGARTGMATAGGPPPGWYPDPSGRHEYRFFTGQDWTADVVDNGTHFTEPLPAPPAP
jgi:hypothetical protein